MEITKAPDANGVYEATVRINGKEKKYISTFFPKHWTPEDVINAIEEAYANKYFVSGNTYEGITSSGISIGMHIDLETGKIISAFPKIIQ